MHAPEVQHIQKTEKNETWSVSFKEEVSNLSNTAEADT